MMILPMIAASLVGAPAAQWSTTTDQLANLFISACFDGSVKLSATEVEAVSFDKLPEQLRTKLVAPDKAQIWRLRSNGETYLYILDYQKPDHSPQICGMVSDSMSIAPASATVANRVGATVDVPERNGAVEWWLPEQGYMALASRLRGYTVLQVNQLSEQQRKEVHKIR